MRDRGVRPISVTKSDFHFLVADTGVRHELAGSEYNKRRATCEAAAHKLAEILGRPGAGLAAFRFGDVARSAAVLSVPERRAARHVTGESERVRKFVAELETGNLGRAGRHHHLYDRGQ